MFAKFHMHAVPIGIVCSILRLMQNTFPFEPRPENLDQQALLEVELSHLLPEEAEVLWDLVITDEICSLHDMEKVITKLDYSKEFDHEFWGHLPIPLLQ